MGLRWKLATPLGGVSHMNPAMVLWVQIRRNAIVLDWAADDRRDTLLLRDGKSQVLPANLRGGGGGTQHKNKSYGLVTSVAACRH
jgi:hypothetical protein